MYALHSPGHSGRRNVEVHEQHVLRWRWTDSALHHHRRIGFPQQGVVTPAVGEGGEVIATLNFTPISVIFD